MGFFKKNKKLIIIAVLLFTLLLVYRPHSNYRYPLHIDEWIQINEEKKIINGEGNLKARHEIGFQLFLLMLDYIGFDIVLIYRFLPAIFACISSIVLFYLVSRKINFYCGVLAMIFFAALPSNVNILGLWFFVSLTLAIPLIYLFVHLFTEAIEKDDIRKFRISFLIILLILFIHPSSALFIALVAAIHILFNQKFLKKYFKVLLLDSLVFLLPLIWFFYHYWRENFITTFIYLLGLLKFGVGYIPYQLQVSFVYLYGWLPLTLALIGSFFALRKKNLRIFIIWVIVALCMLASYHIFKFSLFASKERTIYFAMLGFVPLSAFGLYIILKKAALFLRKKKLGKLSFIFILIIIAILFHQYYRVPPGAVLYHVIGDEDYEALEYLDGFDKSIVMVPQKIAPAVYPIAGHEVISCRYWRCKNETNAMHNLNFYKENTSCYDKERILAKYNADYVLSKSKIDCGWELLYSKNNIFIYKAKLDYKDETIIIDDFEKDNDLWEFEGVEAAYSKRKVEGKRSLRIDFKKNVKYPKLFIDYYWYKGLDNVWSLNQYLEFDIYSENVPLNYIRMHIGNRRSKNRLVDGTKNSLADFSINGVELNKWHHIKIEFDKLEYPERNDIIKLTLFVVNSSLKRYNNIIYIDELKVT